MSSYGVLCLLLIPTSGEVRALFDAQQSADREYDVIISKIHGGTGYEYEARLILYTAESAAQMYSEWKLLLANPCLYESPVDAMADLLEGLYERAGKMIGNDGRRNISMRLSWWELRSSLGRRMSGV